VEVLAAGLIGREAELRALMAAIDADRSTVVVGEAGIGKTTLVRAAVAAAGRRFLEGGGFSTLDWLPYLALRRALGFGLHGDPASVAARLESVVGPDVLFVDDLQWVDHDSLAAIELAVGRILVVATLRTGDAGTEVAAAAADRAGMATLEIGGLDDAAAAEVVRRARPEIRPEATARIVRRAAGNPLLLEELALAGQASTVLERALSSRATMLSPEGRATVEVLAVAEEAVARVVAGAGLDEAVRAGIARAVGDGVEIRHELVASAIRRALPADRLAEIHRLLAGRARDALTRARHLAAAGQPGPAAAVAITGLESTADPRDRAALLVIAAGAAEPSEGMRLRLRAARALDEVADWAAVQRALEPAGETGSDEERVERDALLAHAAYATGDVAGCRRYLDAASARSVDEASPAGVRRAIEQATYLVNGEGGAEQALRILDRSPRTEATDVLRASIGLLATGEGDPGVVAAGLETAFATGAYRTATDRARVLQYLLLMGSGATAALEFLLAQRARFGAAGITAAALDFHADAVVAGVLAGRLELAATLADELLEQPSPLRARQMARIYGARALFLLGRFNRAADALTSIAPDVSADFFGRGELLSAQADLAFWSGRAGAAAKLADAATKVPAPIPIAHVPSVITRSWARLELGRDPAASIPTRLTPSLAGAQWELEGLAAWHAGDNGSASSAFAQASTAWGDFETIARLRCGWAASESRRRDGGTAAAVDALRAVLDEAVGIGFEPLAARVRRSLRLAGVRATGSTRSETLAAGGLTAREGELVGLVEQGLTNLEIARRLGLGRPTVTRILASAMLKLGVSSRAQLAAMGALPEKHPGP
jgi:DNA-binding CsgD family transcriptional regulator